MQVTEVGNGVFLVVGRYTNWCLIRDSGAVTLVDGGWPRDHPEVVGSLDVIGARPHQVDAVLLTHAHPDHIGVAERFRADHEAPVHTHVAERRHALGEVEQHVRITDLLLRLWRPSVLRFVWTSLRRGGLAPKPVTSVNVFGEGPIDVPGRPTPIHTPGHTDGHCAFHLPEHGVLITGDALVNHNILTDRPGPRLMPGIFNHDPGQALDSIDRLSAIDADVLLTGHGQPLYMTPAAAVLRAKERHANARWWDR